MNPSRRTSGLGAKIASYAIAAVVLAPVLVVCSAWLLPRVPEHWSHLRQYVLPLVLWQTAGLLLGVSLVSLILGVSVAWLCAQYEFWGRGFLRRALILPLALPAYVSSFVYIGLLDFTGPLRTALRAGFGSDAWVPEVRSLGGGIVIFSLCLYPYIYVLSYDAFTSQGKNLWEAARSLGASPLTIFVRLGLALARPWIAGGLCLVALEVLGDFGTVSILGLHTFTTAIYKAWYGFFSTETAAQLASFLIVIAFIIYGLERSTRRRRSYVNVQATGVRPRLPLTRRASLGVSLYLWGLLLLAFGIPCFQLLCWGWASWETVDGLSLLPIIAHSVQLGSAVAGLSCIAAATLAMSLRYFPSPRLALAKRLAYLGYGIPGSVLAIGLFLPMVRLDHWLVDGMKAAFAYSGGLILTGTLFTMTIALTIRFVAVAGSSVDAGLDRLSSRLDESAQLFGAGAWEQFWTVHGPLLRRSFASAALLVFVDVVKEMPLTLMTRPFGWDTLSVQIYSLISEGEWQRASIPALLLLLIGLLPLLILKQKEGS